MKTEKIDMIYNEVVDVRTEIDSIKENLKKIEKLLLEKQNTLKPSYSGQPIKNPQAPATDRQKWLLEKAKANGAYDGDINSLTKKQASDLISEIKEKYG